MLFFFSPFLSPACVAPPCAKDPPSALPPFSLFFSLSVPLFLCFVLSLPLSPSSFPLHAVVCRHAGISGPQNDRPNLSALAPVPKDDLLGSVCVCLWLVHTWVISHMIGHNRFLHSSCCCQKCKFQCSVCLRCNLSLLSNYHAFVRLLSLLCVALRTYVLCHAAVFVFSCVWKKGVSVAPVHQSSGKVKNKPTRTVVWSDCVG